MAVTRRPFARRPLLWALLGLAGLVIALAAMFVAAVPLSSERFRHRIVRTLSETLDSDVELGDLHLRVFPGLHAEGVRPAGPPPRDGRLPAAHLGQVIPCGREPDRSVAQARRSRAARWTRHQHSAEAGAREQQGRGSWQADVRRLVTINARPPRLGTTR